MTMRRSFPSVIYGMAVTPSRDQLTLRRFSKRKQGEDWRENKDRCGKPLKTMEWERKLEKGIIY